MTRNSMLVLTLAVVWSSSLFADWTQFRGGIRGGVAQPASEPPTEWNVKDGTNIAWTAELPGRGPASPIVIGDRVIVTSSSGAAQDRMHVLCYDSTTGKQLWQRQFWATGRCFSHPQSSNAAPTPASDGQRIFAFYSSNDLVCLDLEGNLLWYRGLAVDYPKAGNDVGMSSSPLVVGNVVVVQVENQGDSFAAGIDTASGETKWRIPRDPVPSWCSPTLLPGKNGEALVLLQSPKRLSAVEAKTGKLVWEQQQDCEGIPSPTVAGERVYVASRGLTALDLAADLTKPQEAWQAGKLGPGAASPILYQDRLYTLNRAPVLTCAAANTGEILWQLRLKGAFWATPLVVGQRMYCPNFDGACLVVQLGSEKGETIATNEFGEGIQASPAVQGDALFFRSDKHLWKVAGKK